MYYTPVTSCLLASPHKAPLCLTHNGITPNTAFLQAHNSSWMRCCGLVDLLLMNDILRWSIILSTSLHTTQLNHVSLLLASRVIHASSYDIFQLKIHSSFFELRGHRMKHKLSLITLCSLSRELFLFCFVLVFFCSKTIFYLAFYWI